MASMGPAGFGHPNVMQQHPGVPGGHPMGPGMPHNLSQQGVPGGGMPPHLAGQMGVSGAPGNQIPTSLMGTMPPVAGGPNAHALQHLSPGHAQMFAQQQLHGKTRSTLSSAVPRGSLMLMQNVWNQARYNSSSTCNHNNRRDRH
jgi:hypothetical protein